MCRPPMRKVYDKAKLIAKACTGRFHLEVRLRLNFETITEIHCFQDKGSDVRYFKRRDQHEVLAT